jgi:hypothetical protein
LFSDKGYPLKIHVRGIFYDLAKASDCVNHEILLPNLHFDDIQGTVSKLVQILLYRRKTKKKTKTEIKSSSETPNFFSYWGTRSSPGSILGPLLLKIGAVGIPIPCPIIHIITRHTHTNNLPMKQLGIITIMIVEVFVLTIRSAVGVL